MTTKKTAKSPKKKYHVWNVFLLKKDYSSKDKYLSPLKKGANLTEHAISIPTAKNAILFTKQVAENEPTWAKHFNGITQPKVSVRSKAAAALMIIETQERTFALAFGFGRSLLNSDAWEQEFGLKIVLNNIGEEGIKEIQLSAFDALLQSKQAQSVRNARIDEFGLDVEQDVIRSLTGIPADHTLGRGIGGRDSLRISTETSILDLPNLMDRILKDSVKDDYLKTFSWIGRMKEIRDKNTKKILDEMLITKFVTKDLERMWMAPPAYQDWEAGRSFVIHGVDEVQDDLRLAEVLDEWDGSDKLDNLTIENLRAWKIETVDDNGQEIAPKWSIYRTIYCEIDLNNETYLLNNASWYKIEKAYLQEVNSDIDKFPKSSLKLSDYNDKSEEDYNARICKENTDFCLMDRKFINLKARGYTQVEFCDLITTNKEIVHVKRYSGSSELSHLFAQGIVPAELFLNVSEFREKVNAELSEKHQLTNPKDPIDPKTYEVVYAIVSKSTKDITLPFFSKVMLRHAKRTLENLNYRVSLCKISNVYQTPNVT